MLASDKHDNHKWIEMIATVVTGKAPENWNDLDLYQCKNELEQIVFTFQRLVALHADHRVHSDGGFVPYRITITKPDGNEIIKMSSFDKETHVEAREILKNSVEKLKRITGSKNGHIPLYSHC